MTRWQRQLDHVYNLSQNCQMGIDGKGQVIMDCWSSAMNVYEQKGFPPQVCF